MDIVSDAQEEDVLNKLRDIIKDEKNLNCPTSDEFLIRFIRASKNDEKKTHRLIKEYYKAKRDQPNEFVYQLPKSYENIISRTDLGFLLPSEDIKGRKTLFIRFGNIDPAQLDWYECIQVVVLIFEWMSKKPDVQRNGINILLDGTNLSYRIMRWAQPSKLKTIVRLLEESIPLRFEALHIVNPPVVAHLFFGALKPFLCTESAKKFIWHSSPYEQLHDQMISENLPEWVGGSLNLESIKDWYQDIIKDDTLIDDQSFGYKK